MTPSQVVALVGIVSQVWPSMKINEYTADAWRPLLEDLAYPDASAAVAALARTRSGYIDPAAIRHQAARTAGLIAPPEGDAFQMATKVASAGGRGVGRLHAAVQDAYWQMGGATGFEAPPGVIRPQWGRFYGPAVAEYERNLLGADLGAAIEARRRMELGSGST
jgi:hypothetical protein